MTLMKIFLLVFFVSAVFCQENYVVLFDEEFDLASLSRFDPLNWLPDVKLNFDKLKVPKMARGQVNLVNLYLEGFSKSKISVQVDTTIFSTKLKVTINSNHLNFTSNYYADGAFAELVRMRKSRGSFLLEMQDVQMTMIFNVKVLDKSISLKDIKFNSDTNIKLSGLFGNEPLSESIGKEVADIIPLMLNHPFIINALNESIIPIINVIIHVYFDQKQANAI